MRRCRTNHLAPSKKEQYSKYFRSDKKASTKMTRMIANMIQQAEPIVEVSKTKDEAFKMFKKTTNRLYNKKPSESEVNYVIDLLWNERETIFKLLGNPANKEAVLAMT